MYLCRFSYYLRIKKSTLFIIGFIVFQLTGNCLSAWAQGPPTIISFSPTTVCQGDVITITGTNFTGATVVKIGSLNAANFTVNDASTITATVANLAASGTVDITTTDGTASSSSTLTINQAPIPRLNHVGATEPFANCNNNATYQLNVSNSSSNLTGNNAYKIEWGDNTTAFTQTNWPANAQTSHTYTSQGYFEIRITITPENGCSKTTLHRFFNGQNPLASITTTNSTSGLCVPATIEFQIGNWYNNSPGTTYRLDYDDGTPSLTLSHPLNNTNTIKFIPHTYTTTSCPNKPNYTARLVAINGCLETEYTVNQIGIRKKPIVNFSTSPNPPCVTAPVCFINTTEGGYAGGNSCIVTADYTWEFGDGQTATGFTPPCHTYAAPGTYNVKLTAANGTCGDGFKTIPITVLAASPSPVTSPISYCRNAPAASLTATGTGLRWYTSATGGTGSAIAPTPLTTTAGTFTWYVSQSVAGNCESQRVPITVTVNNPPAAPTVSTPLQLCQNQTANALTAAGSGLLWYGGPTGGIGSSTPPIPSTTTLGNTNYYVSQTTNNCEGPRSLIVVVVNSLATAPGVVSPISFCQNQPATPLTATGSGLLWYTTATGGTGSSTRPTPSTSAVGTTTYYVSQTTGCGEGPRATIDVSINASPTASISYSPGILCNVVNSSGNPNLPVPVTNTGSGGGTYSISPATGLIINPSTGEINPSGATAGTYIISYRITGTSGCSDFITTASVTVSGTPAATISYPGICSSNGPTSVIRTGSAGGVFSSTTGLSIDASTGVITPGTSTAGTYTVIYTISPAAPCPGFTTSTTVTITQAPLASISYAVNNLCNVVHTSTDPNLPVPVTQTGTSGGTYTVSPAGLQVNTTTGEINPSGATPGIYTIRYSISGSGGCANYSVSTTVTVNGTPAATIRYTSSPYCGNTTTLQPVTFTGTAGGVYSSESGLSVNTTTGAINPSLSTPGTYTVSYTVAPSAPCPGFVTSTTVTITQAPLASISYAINNLCNVVHTSTNPNLPVPVTQTGTTGGTYSALPAGLQLNTTTGEIDPSGATPGIYTIRYSIAGAGGCADYSVTTTVTVNGTPTATIRYTSSSYCGGLTALQAVTFTGTAGGVYSSAQGLSLNATTGAINPSLSAPGIYTVSYTIAPSAPCPGYIATAALEINESPVLTFPVSNQSICSGGTAIYTPSSTVANTTYSWAVTGPLPANVSGTSSGTASGANASISLSFLNTGTISRTLSVLVTPVNPSATPCPGKPYTLTVEVNPVPPAPVTATANFCMGAPATALNVTPLTGNSIKWYNNNSVLLPGAPVISTSAPLNITYFVSQTNSFQCESPKANIQAIVHPTPKIVSSSFAHPTTCGIPSGSIVLDILDLNNNGLPNIPVSVHFDKFQTPAIVTAVSNASGKITIPLSGGTYSGMYVETINGCSSQKIPDVFVLKDPNPPAQPVAGYNPPICSETPLNLTALSPTSTQAGPIDYVWAGPAFGSKADTSRNTVVTFPSASISNAGTYVVYAIQNNCISLSSEFQVVVKQSPSKPVIQTRAPVCIGDDLSLQAYSSIPGNSALEFLWKGPGTGFPVSRSNAAISKVQLNDAGIYTITVTSPVTGCSSTEDTLILIGAYPIVKFAQDTVTLPTGYRFTLAPVITNANQPGILPMKSYVWTPSQDLECNDPVCASPIAVVKNNVCYSVKASNFAGCSGSDTMCIKVFCQNSQVFVANAFTPFGNIPENTRLTVRATGINSVKSFRVFNRWGKIVFERSNFAPNNPGFGWDGRINGKPADTGVYIYTVDVICENGVPFSFKGNVTLL